MSEFLKYYKGSTIFTIVCLGLAYALGLYYTGTVMGAVSFTFLAAVLSVLEVSLSFDNAVVNAKVLNTMDPVWQRRFIVYGIPIAVFGMRIVFPLAIVSIIANIGPIAALVMAATDPDEYSRVITSADVMVSAFGGSFLLMVALKHLVDHDKDVHWLHFIEAPLSKLGRIEGVQLGLVMIALAVIASYLPEAEKYQFVVAGVLGLVTYIAVDAIGAVMDMVQEARGALARSGLASFIYLEVLDASFSFDGVIGAFALTNNLFLIALGLGIGAMFVRSMTIHLVDKGTLNEYRYLEHGAFYAIFALGAIMFAKTILHVPHEYVILEEVFTGLIGAAFIGFSLLSSVRYNRANPEVNFPDVSEDDIVEFVPVSSVNHTNDQRVA